MSALRKSFRFWFEKKQKQLDKLQTELKQRKEDFDKRKAMMKADIRRKEEEELQRRLIELQQTYAKLQQELIEREGTLTQDIFKKTRKIIQRIGDRDQYTMILDSGSGVLYSKAHMDLTDIVVKEYNTLYAKK